MFAPPTRQPVQLRVCDCQGLHRTPGKPCFVPHAACGMCCAVQRDVPGLTRASIPVFVSRGIKAISVGVNAGSAPPGVPRFTPFIWRDEPSGTQILAFWHPGACCGVPVLCAVL